MCVCVQAGDILIARSTDIAWSVYFPRLSGVVTELGGVLSHGSRFVQLITNVYTLCVLRCCRRTRIRPAVCRGCEQCNRRFENRCVNAQKWSTNYIGDTCTIDGNRGLIIREAEANKL